MRWSERYLQKKYLHTRGPRQCQKCQKPLNHPQEPLLALLTLGGWPIP